MERVAFLLESTGERVSCMLNPESLVVRRTAGFRQRRSLQGPLTGSGLADDPLVYTGGGSTELLLDLLFDVSISGSSIKAEDVRELTAPLWRLAENIVGEDGYGRPPLARFVWGKTWSIPGIVASVAERLENFTPAGAPRRSWMRMRFLRVVEPAPKERAARPSHQRYELPLQGPAGSTEQILTHEVKGGESGKSDLGGGGERLDQLAHKYYGDPSLWRLLAAFNNLDDPMRIPPGCLLKIPPLRVLKGA